jgi:hypothetical protein
LFPSGSSLPALVVALFELLENGSIDPLRFLRAHDEGLLEELVFFILNQFSEQKDQSPWHGSECEDSFEKNLRNLFLDELVLAILEESSNHEYEEEGLLVGVPKFVEARVQEGQQTVY